MKKKTKQFLTGLAIVMILFSGCQLINHIKDTFAIRKTETLLEEYKQKIPNEKIRQVKEKNKDVVGWIHMNDTNIDYPIVQTDNNDYYLTHDFNKQKNKAGWIYMDFRNQMDFSNRNTILYGHGRIDGTMFGTLKQLLKKDWWEKKSHLYFTTESMNKKITWEIFSVYTMKAESYYLSTYFSNTDRYKTFLRTIKNRSFFSFDVPLNTKDQILTLSTCKNEKEERIVVHAKKIKEESL